MNFIFGLLGAITGFSLILGVCYISDYIEEIRYSWRRLKERQIEQAEQHYRLQDTVDEIQRDLNKQK